jgi:hypothetical protein
MVTLAITSSPITPPLNTVYGAFASIAISPNCIILNPILASINFSLAGTLASSSLEVFHDLTPLWCVHGISHPLEHGRPSISKGRELAAQAGDNAGSAPGA